MTELIYLSPAVADAVVESNRSVVRELEALRQGMVGSETAEDVNPDEIEIDDE